MTRRRVLAALGTALVPGLTACSRAPRDAGPASTPSPGEAPADVWFGVAPDLDYETVAAYAKKVGRAPAVVHIFHELPFTAGGRTAVHNAAEQTRRIGGKLLLTLQPLGGLDTVTDAVVLDLARLLHTYNDQGLPVIVRFAHEMNGTWYPWGQDPATYVSTFRRVAAAVHQHAPGSAMMWAPNYGGGYPFASGDPDLDPEEEEGANAATGTYAARPGTEAYRLLDTNGDGKLTHADDPYAPYWPGPDAVDWVGMSLYHWGRRYPWGANVVPEPGKFVAQLRGTYRVLGGDQPVPDFYRLYAARMRRPLAIPETAALYTPGRQGASELAIKRGWWRQVFADEVHQGLPWLSMICWFEWEKYEAEVGERVDWSVTRTPRIRSAFRADLPPWLHGAATAQAGPT